MESRTTVRWSPLLGAVAFAACALVASHAQAFALKVTPIPIVISGGATSTMVELRNESSEPIRIQATGYDWTQTPGGEDKTSPSTELLIFPSMVTIPPNDTRKLRVGTQGGYGPTEKSFRVLFAELPSNVSPAQGQEEVVKVVANVSVPIFVRPPGATGATKIQGLSATKDRVRFGVQNTGSSHVMVEAIRVDVFGDTNKLGSTEVAGWYILPGLTRPFDVDISKLPCAGAKRLVVTASSREWGFSTATIEQPACAR